MIESGIPFSEFVVMMQREVADRILFMEDGVIVEDAPQEEFFEHPKNDRIRQFIRKVEER